MFTNKFGLLLRHNYDNGKRDNLEMSSLYKFISESDLDINLLFEILTYNNNVFCLDLRHNVLYISDRLKEFFGLKFNTMKDGLEEWKRRIACDSDLCIFNKDLEDLLDGRKQVQDLLYKVKDAEGREHWTYGQVKLISKDNDLQLLVGRVALLNDRVDIDPVTKLRRKNLLLLNLLNYTEGKAGLIGFNLNHMRIINDSKGRNFADMFIKEITETADNRLNNKIDLYRIEGMKFLAVAKEEVLPEIQDIAAQLKTVIVHIYKKYNFTFNNPVSIGVYIAETEAMLNEDVLDIVDKIISLARKDDKSEKLCIFSHKDLVYKNYLNRIELELLKSASSGFENFRIVVQPIIDSDVKAGNRPASAEVLLRWNFEGNSVSPEVFVPILEKTRLIEPVGKFVFEEAAKLAHEIKKYNKDIKLNVNISYIQILDKTFIGFIENTLKKYKLNGSEIVLELTERNYDEDKEKTIEFTNKCKNLGMMIAIDDFGTGYSSISFLIRYHAEIVKIDKSLVKESIKSADNRRFMKDIISACRLFKILICVEGIEKKEELEMVKQLGCRYIQGFYFYKPMERNRFVDLMKSSFC